MNLNLGRLQIFTQDAGYWPKLVAWPAHWAVPMLYDFAVWRVVFRWWTGRPDASDKEPPCK